MGKPPPDMALPALASRSRSSALNSRSKMSSSSVMKLRSTSSVSSFSAIAASGIAKAPLAPQKAAQLGRLNHRLGGLPPRYSVVSRLYADGLVCQACSESYDQNLGCVAPPDGLPSRLCLG